MAAHANSGGAAAAVFCKGRQALREMPVTMLSNQLSVGQTITNQYDTDGMA